MRYFTLHIILRIGNLFLSSFLINYFLFINENFIRFSFLLIWISISILELFSIIRRNNKKIEDFFSSLYFDDYKVKLNKDFKDLAFPKLYKSINKISQQLYDLKKQSEGQQQYLESLLKEAKLGLIAFDANDRISFVNQSFRDFFHSNNYMINKQVGEVLPQFKEKVKTLKNGEKQLIDFRINDIKRTYLTVYSFYKFEKESFHLYILQDIKNEIQQKELESWQKLLRVLTHEIMNSTIPIYSLSSNLNLDLKNGKKIEHNQLQNSIEAISDRSSGLMKFSQAYQKLSKLPKPQKEKIDINLFINRIKDLFYFILEENNIELEIKIDKASSFIFADKYLVEQVMVNLLKNAIESFCLNSDKKIIINFLDSINKSIISISDSGVGISEEEQEKLFVPFYSTKEEGEGIGLSLSQQIMLLHAGDIQVNSRLNEGTEIRLIFPK